jgi:hypothetical protein
MDIIMLWYFYFLYIIYVYIRVYHRKYIEPECAGYRNQDFPAVLILFYFIHSTCIPRPYLAISSDLNRIKKKQNNILKRMGDLKIRGHL